MILHRVYRYRLYPTPEQVARLERWEHALRFLWNLAHGQRIAMGRRCKVDRKFITAFDQQLELTELRAMLPWLADVPRDICAKLLVELDDAWRSFFSGTNGYPKFKTKGCDRAPMVEPHPKKFSVDSAGSVVLSKLGTIPAVIHRPMTGRAKQCSIVRDGDQWFASIVCEQEIVDPTPSTNPPVAIDRGIALLLADSNRGIVDNPRHAALMQPRIARAQRSADRKKKDSNNQKKAKAKVARLRRKVRRQREHVLHAASRYYAKSHGVVIVEKLKIQNMTRSAAGTVDEPGVNVVAKSGLNREILSAGWGRFVEMLRYKVVPEGGRVVEVPAAYSSQTCSACGVVDAASRRSQDVFLCTSCGHFDNADLNAASVLLARGLKQIAVEATVTVCGGMPAREAPVKQKLRVVRRGTRPVAAEQSASGSTG